MQYYIILIMISLLGKLGLSRGWIASFSSAIFGSTVGMINPNPEWLILAKHYVQIVAWLVAIIAGIISIIRAVKNKGA